MKINSKKKGSRGELELCHWLKENMGIEAERSQQYCGNVDAPDVILKGFPDLHIECKRTEALSIYKAMEQASVDCKHKLPMVAHRRSRKDWLFIVNAKDLTRLVEMFQTKKESPL